ncbi:MAG: patatin-like phospholipase family protein [Cyclobacteriaceae bacterium]
MNTFINFILNKRTLSLWISVIFCLLMGAIMNDSGQCLRSPRAPRGIISLELTFKQEKADRIKNEWTETQCLDGTIVSGEENLSSEEKPVPVIDVAIANTKLDFIFIIAYSLLLAILIIRKNVATPGLPVSKRTRLYLGLVCIVAVCDIIENIFMLRYLQGANIYPAMFAMPAVLKFTGLFITLGYILSRYMQDLSRFFERFMITLWRNRVSMVGFLIMYFALWKSNQGQDLLLNLNAHHLGPALFYFILTVLAALNWFLPKYYTNDFVKNIPTNRGIFILFQNPSHLVPGEETNVPRIMGILTFIIPACGILNALNLMKIDYFFDFIHPMLLLIITTGIYMGIIHKNYLDRAFTYLHKKGLGWIFFAAILIMLGFILLFGVLNKYAPYQLANLSIGLYLMSVIFYIVTTLRSNPDFYKTRGLGWLQHQLASSWLRYFAMVSVLTFVTVSLMPLIFASLHYARFITLPIIFTGITFYTAFFYVLLVLGKYSGINWAAIVLVAGLAMAIAVDNRFHDIYRMDRTAETTLQTLDQYIDNWVTSRKAEIDSTKVYPVFIVNTYGGGIRAAAWTSLVVSHLDSITKGEFQRHVFAYSGASGGTIGASVMCALRKSKERQAVTSQEVLSFYKNDFLSPVLIGLMGRDIFFSTTGWDAIDDRARLQDHIWESHLSSLDKGIYSKEFSSLWYDPAARMYDIPLLFANTYHVESGLKGIVAPVKLSTRHFPQAVDVNEKLSGKGIPLSTASFLSARFPYMSPAGKLDASHHFLDGGLKENSGAETAYELYTVVRDQKEKRVNDTVLAQRDPDLVQAYSKIQIYFLSLNNTGTHDPEATTKNLVELTAPITALYNNWVGNTLKADSVLGALTKPNYFQLRPLKDTIWHEGIPFSPVLPLGWQISDFALQRLNESLTYPEKQAKPTSTPGKIKLIVKLLEDSKIKHNDMPIASRSE